ncbi:hypothetical protein O3P69_015420 [Scylla paramamosain]|uniref:Uncharacterized protein n=1 Tax=Scylla paramamosain TaxID=85552 RepID=A0AAW0T6G1_SCYPA
MHSPADILSASQDKNIFLFHIPSRTSIDSLVVAQLAQDQEPISFGPDCLPGRGGGSPNVVPRCKQQQRCRESLRCGEDLPLRGTTV